MDPAHRRALLAASESLDDRAFDRAWSAATRGRDLAEISAELAIPFLHEVGELWESGDLNIVNEHFASQRVRRRLLLMLPTNETAGPTAVIACPRGERHDLGALAFATVLADRGWRVRFLGADVPLAAIGAAARNAEADLIVAVATRLTAFEARYTALATLARSFRVAVGGAGAEPLVGQSTGATVLPEDLIKAAEIAEAVVLDEFVATA